MKRLAVIVAGALLIGAAADVSKEQAAAFQRKLVQILQHGERKANTSTQQAVVTEDEVNSYLRFGAGDQLPVGVTDPSVVIHGEGRLSGRAIVDLDVIRKKKGTGGWFDAASYLTGRLPLTASGILRTKDGVGHFELASAEVSGISIPKPFLQEIVSFYSRTDERPGGINIDQPFELPARIRRIEVEKQRATIVQ